MQQIKNKKQLATTFRSEKKRHNYDLLGITIINCKLLLTINLVIESKKYVLSVYKCLKL